MDPDNGWYRVDVYDNGKLISTHGFSSFGEATRVADEEEEKNPAADVQLWSRER